MKREKGITLIALMVTVIVLLILASVSISTLRGDNGLVNQSTDAKEQTEIAEETEILNTAITKVIGGSGIGNITEEKLRKELDKIIGADKYDLSENGSLIVTYKESGRSYVVSEDGKILDENERLEIEKKSLKFLVNSGNDGSVVLPISLDKMKEGNFEVDWGDGTTGINVSKTNIKTASLDKKRTAALVKFYGVPHLYSDKNKEYTVTITGTCNEIYSDFEEVTKDKIIEVLQWGETGLKGIYLAKCHNLRKIASPSENSFVNIYENGFEYAFSDCSSLTEIPEDLFSNCSHITSFNLTFTRCISLTRIPENLFANCSNVNNFVGTFSECSNLTGNPIDLWKRVPDGASNDYIGIPDGMGCFGDCKKLNDYTDIPEYWRAEKK